MVLILLGSYKNIDISEKPNKINSLKIHESFNKFINFLWFWGRGEYNKWQF